MGRRILLIEDDFVLRNLLGRALQDAGHDVETASDGVSGHKAFLDRPHDVVVTDIIMPEREGLETIRDIRKHAPATRIIAISGGGRIGPDAVLGLADRMGADETLSKPFRPSALVALIEDMLQREPA